jgi:hypothetical protein
MWLPTGVQIVLWLHILAACVWIGGQITVAVLIPMLRGQPDLVTAAARRYETVAWFAFAVLVTTGRRALIYPSSDHTQHPSEGRGQKALPISSYIRGAGISSSPDGEGTTRRIW